MTFIKKLSESGQVHLDFHLCIISGEIGESLLSFNCGYTNLHLNIKPHVISETPTYQTIFSSLLDNQSCSRRILV